ncbi:uncharacterized protein Tco025E_00100 [Trypanosoma conorhini]|uniref:Uncharacterized protein n=1 Tax=Trypanosoma conorhini TaxID=83891 RepID=A0A3R7P271_9TRYP|nr:uncharacterized protein Tco025E_00100 [Trypanosoma conorhini]RNF27716.1 hypothetical protein Tco025E_00100 [Trypanosoma conorhini]
MGVPGVKCGRGGHHAHAAACVGGVAGAARLRRRGRAAHGLLRHGGLRLRWGHLRRGTSRPGGAASLSGPGGEYAAGGGGGDPRRAAGRAGGGAPRAAVGSRPACGGVCLAHPRVAPRQRPAAAPERRGVAARGRRGRGRESEVHLRGCGGCGGGAAHVASRAARRRSHAEFHGKRADGRRRLLPLRCAKYSAPPRTGEHGVARPDGGVARRRGGPQRLPAARAGR